MRRRILILAILPSLSSGEMVTYDDDAFPILQQSCLNCHNPDKAKGGLDLSTFAATLKGGSGGKVVEPGDAGSALIAALLPGAEKPMPPEGEKLAGEQVAVLKRWIEGGLLENKSSSARKPTKPKFETTLRSDPGAKPDGPPPMPAHLLLDPPVVTQRASAVQAIAASPWAPLLAVTGQRQVLLYQVETLELAGILPFPEGDPVSLTFTPDARYLIVGGGIPGKSGLTVTFDITNGARVVTVGKEFDSILAADIRPGFDLVATGGPSRLLKIWNTETGELVGSVKKHTDWITALDLSADGVLLASGDRNGGVWVWESDTVSEFHALRGHQAGITAAAFRSDSNLLATASEDGTLRFWEMNGGSEVKKIDAHPGGVTAFAFARDGSSVSAGRDLKTKLWKPDFTHSRDLAQNLPALPTAVAIDWEGKRAFAADSLGSVRVYQTGDGKLLGEFQTNPPSIQTRLEELAEQQSARQLDLDAAGKVHENRIAARDAARHGLSELEKSHRHAVESHQAAQSHREGTAKDPGETMSRIRAIEEALPAARSSLESAEKSVAEATAGISTARAPLTAVLSAIQHWTAATVNTRSLHAHDEAQKMEAALVDRMTRFRDSADRITHQAAALNSKRTERDKLAKHFLHVPLSPETRAELEATLTAIDIRIECELAALQEAESELIASRSAIDVAAPLVRDKRNEVADLRESYRRATE